MSMCMVKSKTYITFMRSYTNHLSIKSAALQLRDLNMDSGDILSELEFRNQS